jgi:hypothetical protein
LFVSGLTGVLPETGRPVNDHVANKHDSRFRVAFFAGLKLLSKGKMSLQAPLASAIKRVDSK